MNILLSGMIPALSMHFSRACAEKTPRKNDAGQERARSGRRKTQTNHIFYDFYRCLKAPTMRQSGFFFVRDSFAVFMCG